MGHGIRIFFCILLCCLLPMTVMAASSVTELTSNSTVNSDGSCQVSMSVTIRIETPEENLVFPLPRSASGVTMNGNAVRATRSGDFRMVDLTKVTGGMPGMFTLNFHYNLSGLVEQQENGTLLLTLPLLSGFAYPVTEMQFSVALPGQLTARPTFSSGYFKESIEAFLEFSVNGATVSGNIIGTLKDHETLSMLLVVPQEQFPTIRRQVGDHTVTDSLAWALLALAAVYWIVAMRCLPVLPGKRPTPPEGVTAGELGSQLIMAPPDLSMMVLSWAQLGYLLIQMDDNGRVLLYKRMDMGNERSEFENRCFRNLFGRKKYMVEGTGYHYARLCGKLAKTPARSQGLFRRGSGNPRILRWLGMGAGLCCGISLARCFSDTAVWGTVLAIFMSIFGGISAWLIQRWILSLHLRNKIPGIVAGALCGLWLILGLWSGGWNIALTLVLGQVALGFLAGYGGRRSELGRQNLQQILGLRRYLKTVSREELYRIMGVNEDYFHEMIPYAIALGVDKEFSQRFGNRRLPDCTYLQTRMGSGLTAAEWTSLMQDVLRALEERQSQLPFERFFGK